MTELSLLFKVSETTVASVVKTRIVSCVNRLYPVANNQILYRRPSYYPLMPGATARQFMRIFCERNISIHFRRFSTERSGVFGTYGCTSDPRIVLSHVTTNILVQETAE